MNYQIAKIIKFAEQGFQKLEDDGVTGVFYIHPWELDQHHPRILLHPKAGITHYCNLRNCEERLGLLLDRFAFTSMGHFFPVSCQSSREG
ncbi:MAG: DUF3473 domain-containing protein [Candidatus Sabulitectum sp.]|nr:DUF3473 domain-containing protein [Candidatus Sabulitectum sp.]